MKIGVNTLSLTPERGGAQTYLINLIRRISDLDQENAYFLFVSHLNERMFEGLGNRFRKITIPLRSENRLRRFYCEQALIPRYVRKHKMDILFSPGNIATLISGCKQVLVVHGPLVIRELRHRYAPREIGRSQAVFYDVMLPLSVRGSTMTIAVSHDIRERLLKQVKIAPSKVAVVYEGVDLGAFHSRECEGKFGARRPYILFLSTLFRYKNADKAIQAFALARRKHKIPHELVIVGRDPGNSADNLRKLAKAVGVGVGEGRVRLLGAVGHEDVPELYRGAALFLYPSTVESFGLPPLEAMACGIPVIGSDRCSVPEIIGDAGLIVDPDDVEGLADAIFSVLSNRELREALIQKGYERVKMFSWEKAAKETLKVFKDAYQGR